MILDLHKLLWSQCIFSTYKVVCFYGSMTMIMILYEEFVVEILFKSSDKTLRTQSFLWTSIGNLTSNQTIHVDHKKIVYCSLGVLFSLPIICVEFLGCDISMIFCRTLEWRRTCLVRRSCGLYWLGKTELGLQRLPNCCPSNLSRLSNSWLAWFCLNSSATIKIVV